VLHDFNSNCVLPDRSEICVIGGGAAGILLATELATAGRHVILLEGGGALQESRSQELYRSELSAMPHVGIHHGRFRTFGGSTTQWGGQILELDDLAFARRSWVGGSGWPISKLQLTDFYERALRFEGLQYVERNDATVWSQLGLPPLAREFRWPELSMLYSRWCPERNFAKLYRDKLTANPNLTAVVHANVVGLNLDSGGTSVESAVIRSFSGRRALVNADAIVICMGGIESTRLLLQPPAGSQPPWQRNGLLGLHFQDHIALNGIGISKIGLQPAHRYFGYVEAGGFRYHNKLALTPSAQEAGETLNVAATISPYRRTNRGRDAALVALREAVKRRRLPVGGNAGKIFLHGPGIIASRIAQRLANADRLWDRTMLTIHCEQSPQSASTISLAKDTDEFGMRRTKLSWTVSDQELHSMRYFLRTAQRAFSQSGFAVLEPPRGFFEDDDVVRSMCEDSSHHMGGCRMSTSAETGVVDLDLKLHGVHNCYVCSSAVFPASGFSNPTHTLLALAMRLSDKLAGN